jgi:ribosomal protein L29
MATMIEMSDEQVVHRMFHAERELVAARFRHSMNQLENTSKLGVLRREIAQLKTEARRREASAGLAKGSLIGSHAKSFTVSRGKGLASADKGGFLSGIVDKLTSQE